MSVERGQLKLKSLSAINCEVMNEDPAWLNVGSHRKFNQPNLKIKMIISQRLLQGWHIVLHLKQCFGLSDQQSSGLDVTEL